MKSDKKLKKIIFLCDWGDDPKTLEERYKFQTKNHEGVWDNIKSTSNYDEADYFIIMGGLPKKIKKNSIPDNKKIYFQREPKEIVKKQKFTKDKAIFHGVYEKHYHLATWQIKKKFD